MANLRIAVVGAGPGCYSAAFLAADLGMNVTLIDPEANPGGVCLYRGCIPSKALLHVAKLVGDAKHVAHIGVEFGDPKIDLDKLRAFKNTVVQMRGSGLGQIQKLRKVRYIQGQASFADAKTLAIDLTAGGTEMLGFEHATVPTGSRPSTVPGLSIDSPRVMDSTSALDLPDVQRPLLVVGGGYIGLDVGSRYAALGTHVTVVEMAAGLLPGADRDLVAFLTRRLEQTLHRIVVGARVTGVKDGPTGLTVTIEGEGGADGEGTQTDDPVLRACG